MKSDDSDRPDGNRAGLGTNVWQIIDAVPAFVWCASPDGSIEFLNHRGLAYTGLSLEQIRGWNWSETNILHPDDMEGLYQTWSAIVASGQEGEIQARMRRFDGEYKWFLFRVAPLHDHTGTLTGWLGVDLEIDERKRSQDQLRRSESYLTEAQKLSHTGSFGWNVPTGQIYWSEETFRILDCDRSIKPTLDLVFKRVHPDDSVYVKQTLEQASRSEKNFDLEHRLLMRDGSVKHVRAVGQVVRDRSGDIEFVGALMDVTSAKQSEETLRQLSGGLLQLLNTIPALVHTALPDGDIDFFNEPMLKYVGVPMKALEGWGWTTAIHPEDVAGIVEKWRASLSTGEPFEYATRVRRADGEYRWMIHRKVALRDEQGKIIKWYGSSYDIEDIKRAEEKLLEQEAEFGQMLDLAPQHVYVQGADGGRLHANKAALDYYGQTLDEFLKTDRPAVFYPGDWERMMKEVQSKFSCGVPHEAEARIRRKDGKYRWFLFRRNPLRDEHGRVMRWYVAATDIEDRKQSEERLEHENVALREEIDKASMFEEIVGTSPALRAVLSRVSKVGPTDSTVLLTGETGTGKELIARAVHKRSQRSSRGFVSVNCAAIPTALIASELFGHEKGAFTGALQRRLGRFELAEGGTIFLDEVGELPLETQVALLRVLQEREFERVGGSQPIRADVRIIAATNRDLDAAIAAGAFRRDLFYRLNVFPIEIPPLRERQEDIPMLVEYFIDRYARKSGKKISSVDKKTLELLRSYSWPGNIRELQNVIERSVIVCDTEIFSVDQSWLSLQPAQPQQQPSSKLLAAQEKKSIEVALAQTGGRVSGPSGAAAMLGIPASTLESRIRSLKVNKFRFKLG